MAPIRLLNGRTMKFRVFGGVNAKRVPPYAILSHVWCKGDDYEIIYQDMMRVRPDRRNDVWSFEKLDVNSEMGDMTVSHAKIIGHIAKALWCGLEWVWIDSCCINKQDSNELSTAINSMFTWYANATRCFVYLADVTGPSLPPRPKAIECFTRGWTLQELLAAGWETTSFFNRRWQFLGSKRDLTSEIQQRTGIAPEHLANYRLACAAVKLSWAVDRQTSYEEDRVYSLLGLFDNMQMDTRYGAGREQNVWREFQEKIIATTHDESIFAWQLGVVRESCGMLAPSIDCFRDSGSFTIHNNRKYRPRPGNAYRVAQGNLLFDLSISTAVATGLVKTYALTLNCWRNDGSGKRDTACIKLAKVHGVWRRSNCAELHWEKRVKKGNPRYLAQCTLAV